MGRIAYARLLVIVLAAMGLPSPVRAQAATPTSDSATPRPASPPEYKLPTKEQKLDAKGLERVLSAKTVAVMASSTPFTEKRGKDKVSVYYRGGRVGPEKAKADVEKVLSKWGAFNLVDDPAQADLVMVMEEQTLGPSFMSEGKLRLKDTLAVFPTGGPGVADPLWVAIDTENALAAATGLTTPDAEGVVERFQREVESARSRIKK
jgi:hypothetical protein